VYGDEVKVEYYDANAPETTTSFAQVMEHVEGRQLDFPVVLIDGELKAAGRVDTYQLMFLVDADRKAKGLPSRF
jgi:disulfide oxidoreductase YuzD